MEDTHMEDTPMPQHIKGLFSNREEYVENLEKRNGTNRQRLKSFSKSSKHVCALEEGEALLLSPECGHQVHTLTNSVVLVYELEIKHQELHQISGGEFTFFASWLVPRKLATLADEIDVYQAPEGSKRKNALSHDKAR